jgi:hypothetical protein
MGPLGFTFLNLGMLGFAALAPLLALAYRRSRPSRRTVVSSVLLLKALERRRPVRQRIKLPFRFFLELLALLLLAAAAAIPVLRSPAENIAIVVDNSLSMSATSGDPIESETRLELAKKEALERISSAPLGSTFSVFATSPRMTDLAAGPVDAAAAAGLVNKVKQSAAPDQLRAAIIGLGSAGQYDRIAVFSDHQAQSGDHLLNDSTAAVTKVTLTHVGRPAPNIYISDLHLEGQTGERSVVVNATLDGDQRVSADLTVSIDGRKSAPFGQQRIEIDPRKSAELRFPLPKGIDAAAILRADLSAVDGPAADSVSADNSAYVAGSGGKANKVLLISEAVHSGDPSFGLAAIGSLQPTTIEPEGAARLSLDDLKSYSLIIFDRVSLASALPVPSLFILPPPSGGVFAGRTIETDGAVTSWAEDHPITSYLRVPLLKPPAYSVIEVPPWAASVINVEQGSILAAGESRGIRFAAVGFELLPYEGAKTPISTVLTLNLVKWLTGTKELAGSFLAGSSYQLEGDRSWVIRTPDGNLQKFTTTESQGREVPFPEPGVYTIAGVSTDSSAKVSKSVTRFVVNTRFPEESQTNRLTQLDVPSNFPRTTAPNTGGVELWRPALWAAIALLLIETLLFFLPKPVEA